MDPNNQGAPNLNAFNNFQEDRKIDNRETFDQISIPMNDQNQLPPVNAPFNSNNNEMQMNGNQLPQQPILNTNQYEFKNFNFNEMNISESGVLESNSNNNPNPTQKLTNQLPGNYNMNKQIKESVYVNQQAPTNQPTGNTNFTENKVENMANMMTDENSNYNQEETLNKSVKTSIIYNDPSKGLQNTENKNTNQITAENNVKLNQNPNSLIKNKLGLQVTNYNVRQFLLNEQVIREKKDNPTVWKLHKMYHAEFEMLKSKWGCKNQGVFRKNVSEHIIIPRYLDSFFQPEMNNPAYPRNIPIEIPVAFNQCHHCEPMDLSTVKFKAKKNIIY